MAAVVFTSVSVGTTATSVLAAASGNNYQFIAIANNGSSTAYLKLVPTTSALTASNGVPLAAGASLLLDQDLTPIFTSGISAICDTGASTTLAVQAY
jgi:hypothetical protein